MTIQGFCNNIYNNDYKIIGWDPTKRKNNVERGIVVTADASEIRTGGGIMLDGEVNMEQGTYSTIPRRL